MFDMAGSLEKAMSLLLSFTGRIGMFGIALTAWITLLIGFEWSVRLIRKAVITIVPGVTYEADRDQELQDVTDYGFQTDDEPADNPYDYDASANYGYMGSAKVED